MILEKSKRPGAGVAEALTKNDDDQNIGSISRSGDPDKSSAPAMVEAVLARLARGWVVTPLCWPDRHGRCACPKRHTNEKEIGKAPLLGNGYQDRLLSREEVLRCWTRYPQANYGILLKPSSLFVLDADSLEADRELEERGVPPGPRGRRGDHVHRCFRTPGGVVG